MLTLALIVSTAFANRNVSLFPTSIFPASFVLSCKSIQTDGPITLKAPADPPAQHVAEYWSSEEGQTEIAMRIWEHAEFDALCAGEALRSSNAHMLQRS